MGFALKGVRRQTWNTRGVTPLVRLPANWTKLSTIGAITSAGKFLQRPSVASRAAQAKKHTKQGSICSTDVIWFLDHLLKHVAGQLVVVLDNAGIHRSKAVQACVDSHARLSLVYLPPYAPELNPIELVWAYVKRNVLGNCCLHSVDALKAKLTRAWQRVRYIHLPHHLMDSNLCRHQ